MAKANQSARKDGTELEPAECKMVQQRTQLCQMKSNDINRMQMELQMLSEASQRYLNELMMKYQLDMTKQYQFNGTALVEIQPPEKEHTEEVT